MAGQGLSRVRVDGEVHQLTAPPVLDKQKKHSIDVIVDRLAVKATIKQRLTDSVETALGLAGGVIAIDFVDRAPNDPHRERRYSERLACPNEHDIAIEELEPRQFSFNGPWGACPACSGLGTTMEVDADLVVPDRGKSLDEGAIAVWSTPYVAGYFQTLFAALAEQDGFSTATPWADLPPRVQGILLNGLGHPLTVRTRSGTAASTATTPSTRGRCPYVRRRHAEAETDNARERFAGLYAGGAVPDLRGRSAQAHLAGGDHRRQEHRRSVRRCRSTRYATSSAGSS